MAGSGVFFEVVVMLLHFLKGVNSTCWFILP